MADTDSFQTQTRLRSLLSEAGARPRRRFGQHFLVDRNLMMKLVDSAELTPEDRVLEVGAGTGSLTGLLAERAGWVVTVEVDPVMAEIFGREMAGRKNVQLLQTDALHGKSAVAPDIVDALRPRSQSLKLVANLPYDIATPLVIDLLLESLPWKRMCFTVQAEVGERFLAKPSTADYGPVGIVTQALTSPARICKVSPQAFWPPPKVASAMIRLEPLSAPRVANPRGFSEFVRSFFLHRRQTMGHLARDRDDGGRVTRALESLRIDARSRPENLTVEQWIALCDASA